ncbi:component of SWI SNF transcription activator complex [Fusarium heterosporum]|uniref:Component of SWI SNF transcription activator complex n=1 Tax=Fusarium heterosporum TaxID=42747 RepID=A0A8H5WFX5_FUSHE|nr:component of SWI SNF transcription activator complex [Fusarium heterosporum]
MGNEQSAETPRGPRKLSKPPHCTQTSATGLPYDATAVTPHRERFANSYAVGPLPPAPDRVSSTRRVTPGLGIAVQASEAANPMPSPTCRDIRRDSATRTRSIQSEQSPRLPSFINSSGTSSIARDSGYRTLARADSMPVAVSRSSFSYDTRAADRKQFLNAKEKLPSEPVISKSNLYSDKACQDVTGDPSNINQSAGSSISRTNSDVSLYMPTRRRSVVQTPGIATRAYHSKSPVSAKSSFRKSLPATPNQSRRNSIESGIARRMSMPTTISSQAQSSARAITPVEADYKQLGGMKFGSLRITNGAPGTSPVPEHDVSHQGASESTLIIPREDYFDEQSSSPPSLTLMSRGANTAECREPMTVGRPVTAQVPGFVAQHSNTGDKSRTGHGGMSENGNAVSFPVAEVLHVREDPNAKPDLNKMQLGSENKTIKDLSRSDSGFIPSPSSEITQRTASRVDSGYGSNVSLRSLPSLRSGITDKNAMDSERSDIDMSGMCSPSDSTSTRTSSLIPSQTRNRLPIHLEVPLSSTDDDTSTCPTSPSSPSNRSFSPFARGSRMRLSSLRSTKSFEPRVSSNGTTPPLVCEGDVEEHPLPSAPDTSRGGSKIYRFLNGSRKKGSITRGGVSAVKQDILINSLELKAKPQPSFQRSSPQSKPSRDTLHTILSVENQDVVEDTRREKEEVKGSAKPTNKKVSRRLSWRQSISQMFGSRSADTSPSLSSVPEADQRRPSTALEPASAPFHGDSGPRAASSWSTRPELKEAASGSDGLASPTRNTADKPGKQLRHDKPELAHLRTNVSAPNLPARRRVSLSPPQLEMDHAVRTKTSPPVSMRTRSAKPRGKSQGHNRPMAPSFPLNSRPNNGRRLSLPQDYGRITPQSRQISHARTESRSSNRGMAMSPAPSTGSQHGYNTQQPRAMTYSITGTHQIGPAMAQTMHHRRVSAPIQPRHHHSMSHARSSTALMQSQQQHFDQQQQLQQQYRLQSSIQSLAPMDMYTLSQQLQQNYIMQNQALVYGAPNMVQQYPNVYVTGPIPNQPIHGRRSSQGGMLVQDAPFRVLHSYNSPAYRNVPIWSQ